jgi:hypothetical protein
MTSFELNDSLTLFLYEYGHEWRDNKGREWKGRKWQISLFLGEMGDFRPVEPLENRSCSNLTQIITVSEGVSVIEWWNKDGQLHRDADRPAKIIKKADYVELQFYENGVLSRCTDKPAILKKRKRGFHDFFSDYEAFYYHNGLLHRVYGPAVIRNIWKLKEGKYEEYLEKEFYINGLLHRGYLQPAIIKHDTKEYWRKGKQIDRPFKTLLKISFQKGYLSNLSTVDFYNMIYHVRLLL